MRTRGRAAGLTLRRSALIKLEYKSPDTPPPEKPAEATPHFALGISLPFLVAILIGSLKGGRNIGPWLGGWMLVMSSGAMVFFFAGAARVHYNRNFLVERNWMITIAGGACAICLTATAGFLLEMFRVGDQLGGLLLVLAWIVITASCNWIALRPMRVDPS